MKKVLILVLLSLLLNVEGKGQSTFLRFHEGFQGNNNQYAEYKHVVQLVGGSIVCIGYELENSFIPPAIDFLVAIYSPDGQILKLWKEPGYGPGMDLFLSSTMDGGFLVHFAGTVQLTNTEVHNLRKYDANGIQLWQKDLSNIISVTYFPASVAETIDSGLVLFGSASTIPQSWDIEAIKLNSLGDSLWTFQYNSTAKLYASDVVATPDGGFLLIGSEEVTTGTTNTIVIKLDAWGNTQWDWVYPQHLSGYNKGTLLSNNGFAISALLDSVGHSNSYVLIIDSVGNEVTSTTFNLYDEFYDITSLHDGHIIITGSSGSTANSNILLLKLDYQLNEVWRKEWPHYIGIGQSVITSNDSSGFIFCGYHEPRAFVGKTDSLGNIAHAIVEGTILADVNNSCVADSVDAAIARQPIQVLGTSNYFGYTNDNGDYSVQVYDTGQVKVTWQASGLWDNAICQDDTITLAVSLSNIFTANFLANAHISCPDLTVSLNTPFLRRCFQNTYVVEYCNQGTLPANNAYLEIEIDPYLTVDSASTPWASQTGNIYRFELDTLNIGHCGSFKLYVTVDCDSTVLGQTHCVSAHIYPDSICLPPNPDWDGSSIKVTGECAAGDTLDFKIENIGSGDMAQPSFFLIAEDNVMFQSGSFELLTGESLTRRFAGNGSTFTTFAYQTEGHPGLSYPLVSIEGCGTNAQGTFSIGFKTQYPPDDQNGFVDILCVQNIGAYDPNDKRAEPQGINTEGYITATQPLDYTIRFQNTGTDTAFTVVIRDTLSAHLDITTLRLNAASHNYTFQIIGSDVLEWTFPNILLPDSNVNEPLSHGFVSFSINQVDGNTPGTEITNRAGIYFDFNPPIITNTTLNTVIADYKSWFTFIQSPESKLQLGLFPNPNFGTFSITFDAKEGKAYEFVIFDLAGAKQFGQSLSGQAPFVLQPELSTGMYIYQLLEDGAAVGMGKVVVYK